MRMNESDFYTIARWCGVKREEAEKLFDDHMKKGDLFLHRPGIMELI